MVAARVLAFYLPQFHPIPENDRAWGAGFTEWDRVVRARALYHGHRQPRFPAGLGFYDLRVPEVRAAQAQLAQAAGIEAFCYWHYWYQGRRLLERPFQEVLATGEPKFPFCLGWANHSWTGAWIGRPEETIVEQTYGGPDDWAAHFHALLPAFRDARYVRVDDQPLFFVFHPEHLPDCRAFTDAWRELARRAGLAGLYLVANNTGDAEARARGFDAFSPHAPTHRQYRAQLPPRTWRLYSWLKRYSRRPMRFDYQKLTSLMAAESDPPKAGLIPLIVSGWDNTPRHGRRGVVLTGFTAEAFRAHVRQTLAAVAGKPPERRLIFLKSWNEWAEGNYVEPDELHGMALLRVLREELTRGHAGPPPEGVGD